MTRSSDFRLLKIVAYVLLCATCIVQAGCGEPSTMSAAESEAGEALKALGGYPVKGGAHYSSLMLTSQAAEKIDETMEHVRELKYIGHLELTNLPVTDEHLKIVKGLKKVNSLVLTGTQVTDAGVETISRLGLDTLYIDKTAITSAAMDSLGGMSKLKILDISECDVMSNLEPLENLKDLEWLILDNSKVDSSAVDILVRLPALGRITLKGATISDADVERLKSAKPSLMIDRSAPETPAAPAEESAAQ